MSNKGVRPLWEALDFRLSEILHLDFVLGLCGGSAAFVLALVMPEALLRTVPVGASVVGVVVGAVVAGLAVQTAFMDQAFLRKIRAIGRNPVRYLSPFMFTATIGVGSLLCLIVLSAFTPTAPDIVIALVALVTGLLTTWTIASLLPGLATLTQFIGLKVDALDVPDNIDATRPADETVRSL